MIWKFYLCMLGIIIISLINDSMLVNQYPFCFADLDVISMVTYLMEWCCSVQFHSYSLSLTLIHQLLTGMWNPYQKESVVPFYLSIIFLFLFLLLYFLCCSNCMLKTLWYVQELISVIFVLYSYSLLIFSIVLSMPCNKYNHTNY